MNLGSPDERFTITYDFTRECFVLCSGAGAEIKTGSPRDLSKHAFSLGAWSVKHDYDLGLDVLGR